MSFALDMFASQTSMYGICEKDTTEKRWSCQWYLRSPGDYIVGVSREGVMYDTTTDRDNLYGGTSIRPAIWVKK